MKTVLQSIGILFALIISFLGMMYMLNGDLFVSAMVALVLSVLLYFIVEQLIKRKSEITKNRLSVMSITLWVFYIVLAIPLSVLVVHCLNVEIYEKENIQVTAGKKISALSNMVNDYDNTVEKYISNIELDFKTNAYIYSTNKSNNQASNILRSTPFNLGLGTLAQINPNNVQSLANNIVSAKELRFNIPKDSVTVRNSSFMKKYGSVFDQWSRLRVSLALKELNKLLATNQEQLSSFYSQENHRNEKFVFKLPEEVNYINSPAKLWEKHAPYLLLLPTLMLQILMLLPYFLQQLPGQYKKIVKSESRKSEGGFEL